MKTKFIAEMVGTMVLVLMGCGAAVLNGGATSVAAVLTIAFAFGLSVVAMAYTIGHQRLWAGKRGHLGLTLYENTPEMI